MSNQNKISKTRRTLIGFLAFQPLAYLFLSQLPKEIVANDSDIIIVNGWVLLKTDF